MTPPERARDPNTPPDDLARLARVLPEDVLANPVLALMALADPTGWSELVGKARRLAAEQKVERLLAQADKAERRRFHLAAVAHARRHCEPAQRPFVERLELSLGLVSAAGGGRGQGALDGAEHEPAGGQGDLAFRAVVAAVRHLASGGSRRFVRMRCVDAAGHAAVSAGACRWFAEAEEGEWQLAALTALCAGARARPKGG